MAISNIVQKGLVSPYITPASGYVNSSKASPSYAPSSAPNTSLASGGSAYTPAPIAGSSAGFTPSMLFTPPMNTGSTTTPYQGYTPTPTSQSISLPNATPSMQSSPVTNLPSTPKNSQVGITPYTGQGLSPDQQANARTPEQIAATNTPTPQTNEPVKPTPYTQDTLSYGGLITDLANRSQQSGQDYQNQMAEANRYNEALKMSRTNEAKGLAGNAQNPIPLQFQHGRGQVLQSQYAQEQAALGAGYQGAANLAGQANTQQGLQLQGLSTAAGLASPQQAGPTNVPFNPLTGQYGTPAAGAYGNGTTGGLQGVGNISGQMEIGGQVAQQNSMLGSAQTTGDALKTLISQNNINPSAFTPFNGVVQTIGAYTSNEAYQKFSGQISDFVSKIAPILGGAGGNTTDYRTQLAGTILNRWASGESINNVITYFLNQAKQNIEGLKTGGGAGYGSQQSSNQQGNSLYSW